LTTSLLDRRDRKVTLVLMVLTVLLPALPSGLQIRAPLAATPLSPTPVHLLRLFWSLRSRVAHKALLVQPVLPVRRARLALKVQRDRLVLLQTLAITLQQILVLLALVLTRERRAATTSITCLLLLMLVLMRRVLRLLLKPLLSLTQIQGFLLTTQTQHLFTVLLIRVR
jgi:hypothetical protein